MKVLMVAAALLAGLLGGAAAEAQSWPAKPVKIIVPYQAGQGTDVGARLFAEQLTKALYSAGQAAITSVAEAPGQ